VFVVELAFGNNPARLAARPAHRQLLARLREEGRLRIAGPFADDSGALLIFDVPDAQDLERSLDEDPYYRALGVTITRQQEWSPIVI
jgi:uncharacterized protein YciI